MGSGNLRTEWKWLNKSIRIADKAYKIRLDKLGNDLNADLISSNWLSLRPLWKSSGFGMVDEVSQDEDWLESLKKCRIKIFTIP